MTTCGVLNILGWDSKHNGGLVPFRILKMSLVVTPASVGGAKAKHGLQAMKGQSHHDYECGSTTPARCQWSLAVGGLWQSRWSTFDATALTPQVTRDDRKEGIL